MGRLVGCRWSGRALEEGLHQLYTRERQRQCAYQVDLTNVIIILASLIPRLLPVDVTGEDPG